MGSARNLLYGLASSLLLFSGAVAIQRTYLSHIDSVIASSRPERDSESRVAGASPRTGLSRAGSGFERESWSGAAPDHDNVDTRERLDTSRSESLRDDVRSRSAATERGGRWSNQAFAADESQQRSIPAGLASGFSFGGGAAVAATPSVNLGSSPPTPAPPANRQVKEIFFGDSDATACQPGGQTFVLDDLRDLVVCIVWSGLSGTYTAQLTFLSPDGHVYQKMTLAFVTADALATVAAVEVEGWQHQVERAGWGRSGETVVVTRLPVAGTYISQHSLVGAWTVKVSLNGQPVDQGYFTLYPRR